MSATFLGVLPRRWRRCSRCGKVRRCQRVDLMWITHNGQEWGVTRWRCLQHGKGRST